jgi:predicted phosphoribosyltransferase
VFASRTDAGNKLAGKLAKLPTAADLVLGIARGGVVVAAAVARKLGLPLDLIVVKKLTSPQNPELAIGALAEDETYIDEDFIKQFSIERDYLSREIIQKHHELENREHLLRTGRPQVQLKGKKVIVVDDGIATGATVQVAIQWVRRKNPANITLGLPVAVVSVADRLCGLVDECVILEKPKNLQSVGQFFSDFGEVTDEEVVELLRY